MLCAEDGEYLTKCSGIRRNIEVLVPATVKRVASVKKELRTFTIPITPAPYWRAMITFDIKLIMTANTRAPTAHTDPVKISENFLSDLRLLNLCFAILNMCICVKLWGYSFNVKLLFSVLCCFQ